MIDPTIFNEVIAAFAAALASVLVALIGWLGRKAGTWLEAKTHSASFACATEKLTQTTQLLVQKAESTLVRELKAASADGKLTKEEGREVLTQVLEEAKMYLGKKGLAELQVCLGHAGEEGKAIIDQMLESHIESRLAELTRAR